MEQKESIMNWERCLENHIKRITVDLEKIRSLKEVAEIRLKTLKDIKQNKNTSTIIVEQYYEVIKELLLIYIQSHGLNSNNHECLISFFFYNNPKYEYEARKIHELKQIRNAINYQGKKIEESYLINNRLEFEHIIKIIKKLI